MCRSFLFLYRDILPGEKKVPQNYPWMPVICLMFDWRLSSFCMISTPVQLRIKCRLCLVVFTQGNFLIALNSTKKFWQSQISYLNNASADSASHSAAQRDVGAFIQPSTSWAQCESGIGLWFPDVAGLWRVYKVLSDTMRTGSMEWLKHNSDRI